MVDSQQAHPHRDLFPGPASQHPLLTDGSWPQLSLQEGMPSFLHHQLLPVALSLPLTQNRVWVVGAPSPMLLSSGCLYAEIVPMMGGPVYFLKYDFIDFRE